MASKSDFPAGIEKVTVNVGLGEGGKKLQKITDFIGKITGSTPVKTKTNKRIPTWGVRPGALVGCKVTLRGKKAEEFLKKALNAIDFEIKESSFDKYGNFSFGIREYTDIPGVKYNPEVGIFGMDICVTIERPGYGIKRRKLSEKIGKTHLLTRKEGIEFASSLGVEVVQ